MKASRTANGFTFDRCSFRQDPSAVIAQQGKMHENIAAVGCDEPKPAGSVKPFHQTTKTLGTGAVRHGFRSWLFGHGSIGQTTV